MDAQDGTCFERPARNRIFGFLVSLVAVPSLAAAAGLIALGLSFLALQGAGARAETATPLALGAGGSVALALLAAGVRGYRDRAMSRIWIGGDRIEIGRGKRLREVRYEDISRVRWTPEATVTFFLVGTADGTTIRIPCDLAPAESLRPILEPRLIAQLEGRFRREIGEGRPLRVAESRIRLAALLLRAVLWFFCSSLLILSVKSAAAGVEGAKRALRWMRQARRGWRGGFEITGEGVRAARGLAPRTTPFAGLKVEALDDLGILLRGGAGESLSASPYAWNSWPAGALLVRLIEEKGGNGPKAPS